MKGLWSAAVQFAERVAPEIVAHELETRGHVSLFIDATGIEVDGALFERARRNYDGDRGYWLHAAFAGGLWMAGQLQPGGGRVTLNWRRLLEWTAGALPAGTPVWLRADNAYYRGELVRLCAARGWDYSISVTNDRWRAPVLEQIEGLADAAWTDLGMEEEAIFATHRPAGWDAEQHCVVVRRRTENGQMLLVPRRTVMLVSRDDLPLAELVLRHRGKQGQENAFKGPLRDMDPRHPPCRGYRANQAFYAFGQIAQVLLRAVQRGAVRGAAEERAPARHPAGHPPRDARDGAHGAHGAPGVRALRQDELPAGLAVPGHGRPGGPRPARRGLTGRRSPNAAPRRGRARPPARNGSSRGPPSRFRERSRALSRLRRSPKSSLRPQKNDQRQKMSLDTPLSGNQGHRYWTGTFGPSLTPVLTSLRHHAN